MSDAFCDPAFEICETAEEEIPAEEAEVVEDSEPSAFALDVEEAIYGLTCLGMTFMGYKYYSWYP